MACTSGRSPLSRTPTARATADATSHGSAIGARLTNETPPSKQVGQIGGDLHGQARLAGAARAGQRQQPDAGIEQHAL